jgi:hypothetical protein
LLAIAVAIEVHEPKGFGRIRLRRISEPTIGALVPFVLMVGRHGSGIAVQRCKSCFHFAGEAASQLTGE